MTVNSIDNNELLPENQQDDINNYRNYFSNRIFYLIVEWKVQNKFSDVDNICFALDTLKREVTDIYLTILTRFMTTHGGVWLVMNFWESWEWITPYTISVEWDLDIWDLIKSNNSYLEENLIKIN